ncbi:uncharacterized protein P884DRAFT_275709 [Thermothelomyces heterothallicus CBS 202.75]|uniref:uncharacterized protein n=1 Tax=Thermothelomyces heterothallicus CBS 202.75 TaxID=1149848 RepID=UPI0037435D5F
MSSILQTMRSAALATKSLASSMRALSLSTPKKTVLPAVQARFLSQAALSASSRTTFARGSVTPAVQSGLAVFQKQQARGMKVRSAIKKRCQHCKVSVGHTQPGELVRVIVFRPG